MPTTKQELEIFHEDYLNSIKNNIRIIGKELAQKRNMATPDNIALLAAQGLTRVAVAKILGCRSTLITEDPELEEAFLRGRVEVASNIRASIVDDALNKDMPYAKTHLDKLLNHETVVQKIDLNVTTNPAEAVSTEKLLEIDLDDDSTTE